MNLRPTALELAQSHALVRAATLRLLALAVPTHEPPQLQRGFWLGVAVLAAALGGLGLILWIAANWDSLGRSGRFALLQSFVLAMLLGAWSRQPLRAPLGLMALLGTGALFAYFGQTYQTGADPWQLFALWAAIALPLCLAVRSDVLWLPWVVVVMTAISLWMQAHTGHSWRVQPDDLRVHLTGWAIALALVAALGRTWARVTNAGAWSWRMAATLWVCMVTLTALGGLFVRPVAPHYAAGLLLLAAWALWLCTRRGFEIYGLSAAAFGINALALCGIARELLAQANHDPIGALLLMGLASAVLLAATVQIILRLARRRAAELTP